MTLSLLASGSVVSNSSLQLRTLFEPLPVTIHSPLPYARPAQVRLCDALARLLLECTLANYSLCCFALCLDGLLAFRRSILRLLKRGG